MKKENTITMTIFLIFLIFVANFFSVSIAKEFDWMVCIISLSLSGLGMSFDFISYRVAENCSLVMKEKIKLYKIIKSKQDRIDNVVNKITLSRDKAIIVDIMCGFYDFGLSEESVVKKLSDGSLIGYFSEKGATKKQIRALKRMLKLYNNNDDVEEIVRTFETKELIKKTETNITASIFASISTIFTVWAFLKLDYSAIHISTNLIILFIVFIINVIGTIEGYFKYRKFLIKEYKTLQDIFETEEIV